MKVSQTLNPRVNSLQPSSVSHIDDVKHHCKYVSKLCIQEWAATSFKSFHLTLLFKITEPYSRPLYLLLSYVKAWLLYNHQQGGSVLS